MKNVVLQLIKNLSICDTTAIMGMYDTSYSHINQSVYRSFIKQQIVTNCKLYNTILLKYSTPNIDSLKYKTDAEGANVVALPLVQKVDSSLNIRSATLYVRFYPSRFFYTDKFLSFVVAQQELIPRSDKIKPLDMKLPIKERYKL